MKDSLKLVMLLIANLKTGYSQFFTAINAIVNHPITLPCQVMCPDDAQWIMFIPDKANIAHCRKGTCRVEERFQRRFAFPGDTTRGNISLHMRSVVYNDIGFYKCSCDGRSSEVKLKVFVPTVVMAHEQENITLPCYGDTRKDAKDVQWKRDEQKVLLYSHSSGTVTTGKGFEGRVSLSQEAFSDGDLSLHIHSVHPADAGLYLCSIHDEFREGEPRAVLLKVEAFHSHGSTIQAAVLKNLPTSSPGEPRSRCIDASIKAAVVLGLFIFLLFIFIIRTNDL